MKEDDKIILLLEEISLNIRELKKETQIMRRHFENIKMEISE